MDFSSYSLLSTDDKLASGDCGHALTSIRRAGGSVPSSAWKSIDVGDFDGYIAAVGTGTPERDFAVQMANHARSNNLRVPRTKFNARKRTPRAGAPNVVTLNADPDTVRNYSGMVAA